MHILGIANGTINGNSEIALKAALHAAQSTSPSVTTSWVHIPSVSIPLNPKPLQGSIDISVGGNEGMLAGVDRTDLNTISDDRQALLAAILDADAYIFATPVYSHSPAGTLKAVFDRICGPFTDAAFADIVLSAQKAGDPRFANMRVDPRLQKPRVVGFMAVGGSSTPDQFTMALPILHTLVYPLHAKVVDQVVFSQVGNAGTIIARHGGRYIERAKQLGRNVASQIGKSFDEAEYLGEKEDGACPYCHLTKVELLCGTENKVVCIACGAQGRLSVSDSGMIRPVWDLECQVSCITWAGKRNHHDDIQTGHMLEAQDLAKCENYEQMKQQCLELDIPRVKLPSQQGM